MTRPRTPIALSAKARTAVLPVAPAVTASATPLQAKTKRTVLKTAAGAAMQFPEIRCSAWIAGETRPVIRSEPIVPCLPCMAADRVPGAAPITLRSADAVTRTMAPQATSYGARTAPAVKCPCRRPAPVTTPSSAAPRVARASLVRAPWQRATLSPSRCALFLTEIYLPISPAWSRRSRPSASEDEAA